MPDQESRQPLGNEAAAVGESGSSGGGKVLRTRETPTLTLPSLSDRGKPIFMHHP